MPESPVWHYGRNTEAKAGYNPRANQVLWCSLRIRFVFSRYSLGILLLFCPWDPLPPPGAARILHRAHLQV